MDFMQITRLFKHAIQLFPYRKNWEIPFYPQTPFHESCLLLSILKANGFRGGGGEGGTMPNFNLGVSKLRQTLLQIWKIFGLGKNFLGVVKDLHVYLIHYPLGYSNSSCNRIQKKASNQIGV